MKKEIQKIVLIGAGNVATNLGLALVQSGHKILQVYSRTPESARKLYEKPGIKNHRRCKPAPPPVRI